MTRRNPATLARRPGQAAERRYTEDCLYLNVTTPANHQAGHPLPVIVWIHGGAFVTGTAASYDASELAPRGDVMVVTVNYRLGVFGYMSYPGLPAGGDFGLLDQLAALRWVRSNAAAFGGDPHNVTVAGQSAGGMSICALLTSPAAGGAFDKAVMQSGNCILDWPANASYPGSPSARPYMSSAQADKTGVEAAKVLHCDRGSTARVLACLRGKDVPTLLGLSRQGFSFMPAYDTTLLPRDPAEALRAGRFHKVPLISGGNRDESRSMAALLEGHHHVTAEEYRGLLASSFGADASRVAAAYPVDAYPSPALAWAAVVTDRAWSCPTLAADRLLAAHTPTYAYEFGDRTAPSLIWDAPPAFPLGAAHAFEMPYLFLLGGLHLLDTPEQQTLSGRMIHDWTRFAAAGHPEPPTATGGRAVWQRFQPDDRTPYVLSFATPTDGGVTPVDLRARHHCDLWTTVR